MLRAVSAESSDEERTEYDFFGASESKVTDTGINTHVVESAADGQLLTYRVKVGHDRDLILVRDPMAGTGGLLWPAGEVLADYLSTLAETTPDTFRDRRILELGSGTGVVGLSVAVHAELGSGCVYLTDLEKVLPVLETNVALNGNVHGVCVRVLEWGSTIADDLKDCDIILIADCVYLECLFEPLVSTLLQVMQKATARGYLCYKKRRKADVRFFRLLRKYFIVEELSIHGKSPQRTGIHLYLLSVKFKGSCTLNKVRTPKVVAQS